MFKTIVVAIVIVVLAIMIYAASRQNLFHVSALSTSRPRRKKYFRSSMISANGMIGLHTTKTRQ